MQFEPGQLLQVGNRFYSVSGVYLGAEGCASMVGLSPLTERPGNAGGPRVEEMLTPKPVLEMALSSESARLFSPVRLADRCDRVPLGL